MGSIVAEMVLVNTFLKKMEIKLLIKAWRDHKHLTFRELSKVTGLSQTTLINWEKGRTPPNKKKIRLLADKLGVTLEEFYAGPDANSEQHEQPKEAVDTGQYAIPEDLIPLLQKVSGETGLGIDFVIRSFLTVPLNMKRSAQLSYFREYLDQVRVSLEEQKENLDHNPDKDHDQDTQ